MRTVHRGVHAHIPHQLARSVRVGEQFGMDPVPGAVLAQLAVTTPHRLPGTELSWHIPPWRAGPEAPDDALHDRPVITEGPPTLRRRLRHQRLDPSPRNVRENLSTRHTPSLRRRSPESYETRPRRTPDPNLMKPNPRYLHEAIDVLGTEPQASAIVGDSVTDIE